MSNLSDLLPAGGGAKVITATASGNLSTGQTVILQSDGTVKAVEQTAVSNSVGSTATVTSHNIEIPMVVYAANIDKFVFIWKGTSSYLYAALGTVSGTSISFGTTTTIESSSCAAEGNYACYDSTNERVAVCYRKSNYGKCRVLNPQSDGSIGIGSDESFSTVTISDKIGVAFNPDAGRVMVAYVQNGSGDPGKFALGTISGTDSISFTQSNSYEGGGVQYVALTYDTSKNAVVILYSMDSSNSYKLRCAAGTISGDSTSWGSSQNVISSASATNEYPAIGYDESQNVPVIVYEDRTDNNYGKARVLTLSTDTPPAITLNTAVLISGNQTFANTNNKSLIYNPVTAKFIVIWKQYSTHKIYSSIGTTSSTSISFDSAYELYTASGGQYSANYDPDTEKIGVFSRNTAGSAGVGYMYTSAGSTTNSSDFAGITNQAINNSASGEVVVEGGVITNGSLLPNQASATFGTDVAFQSGEVIYESICYDTANDKVVIAFMHNTGSDGYAQHGKAVVGTVSGTSISFGSVVTFNAATTARTSIAFDSNSNRVVIAFTDSGNSFYGTAIVGAVSGNSISFGSKVVFESSSMIWPSIAFDSTNNKVLIGYSGDNSTSGYAIVGTVDPSDNSISFGSRAFFDSSSSKYISVTFDSNAGKSLISYMDAGSSNAGAARVATISGTSVTYGTQVAINSEPINKISSDYDSTAQKIVVGYQDRNAGGSDTYYGYASVATISGTDVSFGTAVQFSGGAKAGAISVMYDPTTDATFIFYRDDADSNYGKAVGGIISGTSISFGPSSVFLTANPGSTLASVKDPDQNKSVTAYIDYGNSQDGTAVVGTLSSGIPNFTIGSTYYVQDDGTLSTTSSSVTAGKAIANTTLLLKG